MRMCWRVAMISFWLECTRRAIVHFIPNGKRFLSIFIQPVKAISFVPLPRLLFSQRLFGRPLCALVNPGRKGTVAQTGPFVFIHFLLFIIRDDTLLIQGFKVNIITFRFFPRHPTDSRNYHTNRDRRTTGPFPPWS